LAEERGEAPDAEGYGVRNVHLLAVAPNASSSIICGNTSPSIEPYRANAYTQKTKSGSSLQKNEYLEHILQELGEDNDEVWKTIITKGGSVQHLEFLTTLQKRYSKPQLKLTKDGLLILQPIDKNISVKVSL
jgi:ribonucleoside-diphosphate reductase alpha chain